MSKIKATLITGVAGTTGSTILDLLSTSGEVLRGERVIIGFDDFFRGHPANLGDHLAHDYFYFFNLKFQEIYQDEGDPRFEELAERFDIDEIYHMAAVVPTKYFYSSPELTYEENCKGTIDLFNWALSRKVRRFVVGSTSEVYGHIHAFPANEKTPSNFDSVEDSTRWSYAEGKLLTEHVLNKYSDRIKVCHLRFANTYGVRDMDNNHIIPYLVNSIVRNRSIHVNSRPDEFMRTFLNNKDAARACIELMKKGRSGVAYNIGSTQEVTISQLIDLIIERVSLKIKDFEYEGQICKDVERPGDPMRRLLTSERLLRDTGFTPEVTLEEGIDEMIEKAIEMSKGDQDDEDY